MNDSKKYYGEQTLQSIGNFPVSTHTAHLELVYGITIVKKAAAKANFDAKNISQEVSDAIVSVCDEILQSKYDDQFITAAIQGGAGTSINMNVNEVIANIASEKFSIEIHPNDHVNCSQSTNDANPTGLKIALIKQLSRLKGEMNLLAQSFEKKSIEFKTIKKLGRTHIQDAVPTTLGEEFASYTSIISRNAQRISESEKYLHEVNLGGTAIGNRINASDEYFNSVYNYLREFSDLEIKPALNLMSQTSSQTDLVQLSNLINIFFIDLSKISTDLRILSSGPKGGIGEIKLQMRQPGSSIMPGKVNPVMPEFINQVYYYISGKNLTIEHTAQNSNLELGIMFPTLADSLISIIKIAIDSLKAFRENCIDSIEADEMNCRLNLEFSTAYATLLTPKFGYDLVSKYVKKAIAESSSLREVMVKDNVLSQEEFDELTEV